MQHPQWEWDSDRPRSAAEPVAPLTSFRASDPHRLRALAAAHSHCVLEFGVLSLNYETQDLENHRASAIEADRLLGKVTPLFTGYGALNDAVPMPILVNCHYGPSYLGPTDNSASAAQYVQDVAYVAGDGYKPVTVVQPKGTYNQSWAFGLTWTGS